MANTGSMETADTGGKEASADDYKRFYDLAQTLNDLIQQYEIADATFRKCRDAVVAKWLEMVKAYLDTPGPGDPRLLHKVIDTMDDFLNHRSK